MVCRRTILQAAYATHGPNTQVRDCLSRPMIFDATYFHVSFFAVRELGTQFFHTAAAERFPRLRVNSTCSRPPCKRLCDLVCMFYFIWSTSCFRAFRFRFCGHLRFCGRLSCCCLYRTAQRLVLLVDPCIRCCISSSLATEFRMSKPFAEPRKASDGRSWD